MAKKSSKIANFWVNKNENEKKLEILYFYTKWVGLSVKTISRYCLFKNHFAYFYSKIIVSETLL